jgi:hypothetical protein
VLNFIFLYSQTEVKVKVKVKEKKGNEIYHNYASIRGKWFKHVKVNNLDHLAIDATLPGCLIYVSSCVKYNIHLSV